MEKIKKREMEDLDFEISFCEDLIKAKPDFVEVLVLLGEAYTKRGLYRKGLDVDKRLLGLKPNDPIVNYNLACSYSLIGDIDASIEALKDAVKKGYFDADFMKKDPDLANARKDKRFKKIINVLDSRKGGDINGVWFIQEAEGKEGKEKRSCEKQGRRKAKASKKERRTSKKGTPLGRQED